MISFYICHLLMKVMIPLLFSDINCYSLNSLSATSKISLSLLLLFLFLFLLLLFYLFIYSLLLATVFCIFYISGLFHCMLDIITISIAVAPDDVIFCQRWFSLSCYADMVKGLITPLQPWIDFGLGLDCRLTTS